jgi:hypothetical protein
MNGCLTYNTFSIRSEKAVLGGKESQNKIRNLNITITSSCSYTELQCWEFHEMSCMKQSSLFQTPRIKWIALWEELGGSHKLEEVLARKLGYSKLKAVSDIINGSDVKIYNRSDVPVCHLITTSDVEGAFNKIWPFFPRKYIHFK